MARLFTVSPLANHLAHLALDLAAPDELALTALDDSLAARHVIAPAAQAPARLRAGAVHLAVTSARAHHTALAARPAVVGRVLGVDELVGTERFPARALAARLQLALLGRAQLDGDGVALLEQLAHLPEGGQRLPARLHRARARHAVTAALERHVVRHHLQTPTHDVCSIVVITQYASYSIASL